MEKTIQQVLSRLNQSLLPFAVEISWDGREAAPYRLTARSEIRTERELAGHIAALLLEPSRAEQQRLASLAEALARQVSTVGVPEFSRVLREEALRRLADQKSSAGVRVTPGMAARASSWLTRFLERSGRGSLGIVFDLPGEEANLSRALKEGGLASRIGIAFTSRDMKDLDVPGLNHQKIGNLRTLRPMLALDNGRALPLLRAAGGDAVTPYAFDVGVTGEAKENEPFFDLTVRIAQVVSGLWTAGRIASPEELKNPARAEALKAELLRDLFEAEGLPVRSDLVQFDPVTGALSINQGVLFDFVTEHFAEQAIARSA